MYRRGKTKRRQEKEDANELGCTIADDLLSEEQAKLFFQNLGIKLVSYGTTSYIFIHTIGAFKMPFLALFYLPGNILENLRSEGTMR
jgi:hypothetical protein